MQKMSCKKSCHNFKDGNRHGYAQKYLKISIVVSCARSEGYLLRCSMNHQLISNDNYS